MKSLTQYINEGSWGIGPTQNDSAYDTVIRAQQAASNSVYIELFNAKSKTDCSYKWEAIGGFIQYAKEVKSAYDLQMFGYKHKERSNDLEKLVRSLFNECKENTRWIKDYTLKEGESWEETFNETEEILNLIFDCINNRNGQNADNPIPFPEEKKSEKNLMDTITDYFKKK